MENSNIRKQKTTIKKFHPFITAKGKSWVLAGAFLALALGLTGCGHSKAQQLELPVVEPIQDGSEPNQQEPMPEQQTEPQSQQEPMPEQQTEPQSQQEQVNPAQTSSDQGLDAQAQAPSGEEANLQASGQENPASPSYFGTWQIDSATPSSYSAMSEEDSAAMIGVHFEYFKDYAVYGDQNRLDSPRYLEDTQTAEDFAAAYKGSSLEMLGISKDPVTLVTLENASGIGNTFYIKDENTLITVWDGVFFEMHRSDAAQ